MTNKPKQIGTAGRDSRRSQRQATSSSLAAIDLLSAVMCAWRVGVHWHDGNGWARSLFAVLAVIALSVFFDEVRKIVRYEIVRARSMSP